MYVLASIYKAFLKKIRQQLFSIPQELIRVIIVCKKGEYYDDFAGSDLRG